MSSRSVEAWPNGRANYLELGYSGGGSESPSHHRGLGDLSCRTKLPPPSADLDFLTFWDLKNHVRTVYGFGGPLLVGVWSPGHPGPLKSGPEVTPLLQGAP